MPSRPYWLQDVGGPESRGNRFDLDSLLDSVDGFFEEWPDARPSTPSYSKFYAQVLDAEDRRYYVSPRRLVARFGQEAREGETAWQCAMRLQRNRNRRLRAESKRREEREQAWGDNE